MRVSACTHILMEGVTLQVGLLLSGSETDEGVAKCFCLGLEPVTVGPRPGALSTRLLFHFIIS